MGKASRSKRTKTKETHMRFVDQRIEGQDIELDGNHFERCVIRNCKLTFRGGTLPNFVDCDVADSNFALEGAAKQTILFARMLSAMNLSAIVDRIAEEMRRPLPPHLTHPIQ